MLCDVVHKLRGVLATVIPVWVRRYSEVVDADLATLPSPTRLRQRLAMQTLASMSDALLLGATENIAIDVGLRTAAHGGTTSDCKAASKEGSQRSA